MYYYTLVASLPALKYFVDAKSLPINRVRLNQRLQFLSDADKVELNIAERLLEWHRQPFTQQQRYFTQQYESALTDIKNPVLLAYIHRRINMRVAVAALRFRHGVVGHSSSVENFYGVGELVAWIKQHWHSDTFELDIKLPWIQQAYHFIENQNFIALQRLQMDLMWRYALSLEEQYAFRFEQVFAYVFRWDILHRWLQYDESIAQTRLQNLMNETVDNYQQHVEK